MTRSVIDKFSNNIFTSSASAPSSPATGDVWYDMDTGRLNFVDSEKEALRQQRSDKIKKILKNENSNRV